MPLPRFTHMPLAVLREPFDHADWLFEIKYDGFRALAYIERGAVQLVSRKGSVYKSFSALCGSNAGCLPVRDAILDGEIVHLDGDGRPDFYKLMRRRSPQHFYAFDILWLDGRDLPQLPLLRRKKILRRVVSKPPAPALYADYFEERGTDLFRAVCEKDLEGIVAKRKDGLYTPDETSWVKIRNPRYSQAEGRHDLFEKRKAAQA